MGVGLGRWSTRRPPAALEGAQLPRVPRARPARRDRDADRGRRVDLPGDGRDQVDQDLPRDARHPARRPATCSRPPALIGARVLIGSAIFLVVMAAFGAVDGPLALLALPAALLTGLAFATPVVAYSARPATNDYGFACCCGSWSMPLFLFSRRVLPGDAAAAGARAAGLPHPALARRRAVPRARARHARPSAAPCCTSRTWSRGSWSGSRSPLATTGAGWRSEMAAP